MDIFLDDFTNQISFLYIGSSLYFWSIAVDKNSFFHLVVIFGRWKNSAWELDIKDILTIFLRVYKEHPECTVWQNQFFVKPIHFPKLLFGEQGVYILLWWGVKYLSKRVGQFFEKSLVLKFELSKNQQKVQQNQRSCQSRKFFFRFFTLFALHIGY